VPLSQGNIGHCDVAFFNAISHLQRFEEGTENPRVGGSIPPLANFAVVLHALLRCSPLRLAAPKYADSAVTNSG
jgi:hypothetical protein